MRRMSEVFDLPVSSHYKFLNNADETLMISRFDSASEAQHAARAINHVDALADALASLLEAYFSKGRVTTDDAACALEALKSYVGDDK